MNDPLSKYLLKVSLSHTLEIAFMYILYQVFVLGAAKTILPDAICKQDNKTTSLYSFRHRTAIILKIFVASYENVFFKVAVKLYRMSPPKVFLL